jgi:hypothetical protein
MNKPIVIDKLMCCFCGNYSEPSEMIVLATPLIDIMEIDSNKERSYQNLYSHKKCLVARVDKKLTLDPFITG